MFIKMVNIKILVKKLMKGANAIFFKNIDTSFKKHFELHKKLYYTFWL